MPNGKFDYRLAFDHMPGMCLVLDPSFRIVAQNAFHARETLSENRNVIGMGLFEAFPDNPNDRNAAGVRAVRESLLKVLKTRQTDVMPIVRYDVEPELGKFQTRYWAITNTPILGEDGYVAWILNYAHEVTELAELRKREGVEKK